MELVFVLEVNLTYKNYICFHLKVEIIIGSYMWSYLDDCIPTKSNLGRRGIDVQSTLCLLCDGVCEAENHILLVSIDSWCLVLWGFNLQGLSDFKGALLFAASFSENQIQAACIHLVLKMVLRAIWKAGNCVVFKISRLIQLWWSKKFSCGHFILDWQPVAFGFRWLGIMD